MLRLLPLLAVGALSLAFQEGGAPRDQQEKDVYRIYSLLLTDPGTSHGPDRNPRYLIAEKTRPPWGLMPLERCVQPPADRKAAFQEVIQDFEKRKATPRLLRRELSIQKPYEFLNEYDQNAFRSARFSPSAQRGPADLRFEGVSDLFTLSDVYFSKNGNLALTGLSTWCGSLCGQSRWRVFEKLPNGDWQERPWVLCLAGSKIDECA